MTLIDEVKSRTEIVDLVSSYVDFDTSSRNPKSRCPFHTERTPSFYVFPETGTWRCFGACSTGGDALSFVMKQEGLEFKEALRFLADRAGVNYSTPEASLENRTVSKSTVVEANEVASEWFSKMLLSSEGAAAREYLASRGIDTDMASRHGIGFAPGGEMLTLAGHLRALKVTPEAARDARLVIQGDDRGWRDFFRNRLMIEIRDRAGKVIGFGARSLDGSEPKYLNTPQTSAFDKSRVLYGLDRAGETIRQSRRAVVVEGYMDVITAHEFGFTNVIACMGTAVTPEQLQAIGRLASSKEEAGEVVLCLDADAAGRDASVRALEAAWKEFGAGLAGGTGRIRLDVKVATPVGGKDPDEAIRADSWSWKKSLEEAVPLIDYIMQAYLDRFDASTGSGKAAVVSAVSPLIFAVGNDFDRDTYWERLAGILKVSTERLRSMAPRHGTSPVRAGQARRNPVQSESISVEQMGNVLEQRIAGIEEYLLCLIFQHPELREYAEAVPTEHFLDTADRELFTHWLQIPTLDEMLEGLTGDLLGMASRFCSSPLPPSDHAQRIREITQCVRRLHERHSRHEAELAGIHLEESERTLAQEEREQLRGQILGSSTDLRNVFKAGATGRV